MTIGYKYIAVWEVIDMNMVEALLHTAFDDNRLDGEWFDDVNDDLLERMNKIITLAKFGEKIYEDVDNNEEAVAKTKGRIKSLSVEYNGNTYTGNGSQVLQDVCNDIAKDKGLNSENVGDLYLFRSEPWENPQQAGRFYTRELNDGLHVVTCISGNRKKKKLIQLSEALDLDIKVELA